MKVQKVFIFSFIIVAIISCAKVYYSPDINHKANAHQMISIMPPVISIQAMEDGDYSVYKRQMGIESQRFHSEMCTWLSNYNINGNLSVEIQDPEITYETLTALGYFKGAPLNISEVCEALEVDGMLTSFYGLENPITFSGDDLAKQVGIKSNNANVNFELYDGFSKKVIWSYKQKISGNVVSNASTLITSIMKQSAKKMPYYISNKNLEELNEEVENSK